MDSDGNSEWSDDSEWSDNNEVANNSFVETMPASGYHSDNLVGHEVTNRSNDETVGEISNLVIDESGQVVAVILSVGGVLGIGEREVAIAFDRIERTEDGDEINLFVNLTEDELDDAPEYSNENTFDRR